MSASPKDQQDEVAEGQQSVDELDEHLPEAEHEVGTAETTESLPVKRGRGRPKGSKNKKTAASTGANATSPAIPRKRGRPPKPKTGHDGAPPAKRPRGRPPKNPKPPAPEGGEGEVAGDEAPGESSTKKTPSRPKKAAS